MIITLQAQGGSNYWTCECVFVRQTDLF